MPLDISISLDKLKWFQKKVGLDEAEMAMLRKYRHHFIDKTDLFSKYFFDYFSFTNRRGKTMSLIQQGIQTEINRKKKTIR